MEATSETWCKASMPPCCYRLLAMMRAADGKNQLATDVQLMKITGWGKKKLRAVYRSANWDDVTVLELNQFMAAGGFRPSHQRRYRAKLKRAMAGGMKGILAMRHLKADVFWRKSQVKMMIQMVTKVLEDE
jgi:hypothetical protein